MPLSRGVHAWIEVDDRPLPEFCPQVGPRRTTCFVPSEEGKKFTIRFQNAEPAMAALRGNIFLDGQAAGAGLLLATDAHATRISGQTRWEGLECPFQFARLRTTDEDAAACQDEARLRELGTIRLQIEWVEVVRQEPWRAPAPAPAAPAPVHERAKKAGAHCVTFGHLETARPKHWYSTHRLPFIEPTEFVFQYAPQDWLEAKEIAPPAASSAAASKRRHDSHTASADSDDGAVLDKEEAAVYQRLKAKVDARQSRKRRRVVKTEPREGPRPFAPGEVIDLTGDD